MRVGRQTAASEAQECQQLRHCDTVVVRGCLSVCLSGWADVWKGVGVVGNVILNWILKKYVWTACAGLI